MMINLGKQFFRFSVVGVLSFGLDYGLLFLLTEWGSTHYLVSAALSYTAATVFNYIYSKKYVFSVREDVGRARQLLLFLLLSLCGLGLNTMLMRLGVERLDFHYMGAKILATLMVSVWNFVTRKLLMEERMRNRSHMLSRTWNRVFNRTWQRSFNR